MNSQNFCENCLYFQQHYYIGECKLRKVNCGLCMQCSKVITPTNIRQCEHFSPKIEEIEKLRKEELSSEILKHVEKTLTNLKIYLEYKN